MASRGEIKTQIPDLLGPHPRHIQSVPEPHEPRPRTRPPFFGRALALAIVALFGMVALGIVWVWQRASAEQAWTDRVNAAEPFEAPRKP